MKYLIPFVFVGIALLALPIQAQTISLNLIASVDLSPSDVEPVKVFTLDPGTVVRDYTIVVSDKSQPVVIPTQSVAAITRTRTVTRSTMAMGGYGSPALPVLRVAPVRRVFGLFRGRLLGRALRLGSCSY